MSLIILGIGIIYAVYSYLIWSNLIFHHFIPFIGWLVKLTGFINAARRLFHVKNTTTYCSLLLKMTKAKSLKSLSGEHLLKHLVCPIGNTERMTEEGETTIEKSLSSDETCSSSRPNWHNVCALCFITLGDDPIIDQLDQMLNSVFPTPLFRS